MKQCKLIRKLSILCCIFLLNNTFGYVNHSIPAQNIIFCPEKMECYRQGDQVTCKKIGGDTQYWLVNWYSGLVEGIYNFTNAIVNYSPGKVSNIHCNYKYYGEFPFPIPRDLSVGIIQIGYANFEPLKDKTSKWETTSNYDICKSDSSLSCPLAEKVSLIISQIIFEKNGYPSGPRIKLDLAINSKLYEHEMNSDYFIMTNDELLKACGSVKQCTLYVKETNDKMYNYGTIEVDLSGDMKILKITQPKYDFPYLIQKHELFNTIQFVKK